MMTLTHNECLHEKLIQTHSLYIEKLDEKSKYKEQSIMELKEDIKKVNEDIKTVSDKLDVIIRKSEKSDSELEKRVKVVENKIELYEKFFKDKKDDDNNRTSHNLSTIAIMTTVTGIIVGVIIKFI